MVAQAIARSAVKTLLMALLAAVGIAAASLPSVAPPARASPAVAVAVICDREIAPYRALLDAFAKTCDCSVRVISPLETPSDGLEPRLKAEGVRAVLAVGVQARAAAAGLRELPVVLTMVPQAGPWIAAQPNRYGIEMSLSPRQHLEALRQVFPQAKRVGLVFDPAQSGDYVREARRTAAALDLTLEAVEITQPGQLALGLKELRGRMDVFWLLPDPTVLQSENLSLLLLDSFESRVPLYGFARKYVELGVIAAAHLDPAALGAQAAGMLRRASGSSAGGAGPRWEYARGAQLVLNQRVARKMGIVFGPAALESADVIR